MIALHDVTRRYGDVVALDRMTWSARPGRVTTVLGPNGAGKTTAVEVAEGLKRADSGSVEVLGADPWRAGPEHRARVGVMLQDGGLPPAVRPVALLRHLASFYRDPADVAGLVEALGIGDFDRTMIRRLSGGQRQRVALAAALVGAPDAVFLDEPTSGLDPHVRREVWSLIRRCADEGTTVVLTTHSFEEAERIADDVVIVAAGRVVGDGTPQAVAGPGTLEEAYFRLTSSTGSGRDRR